MKGIENSRIALRSERDENTLLDSRNDNFKVSTGTVITSGNPKYSDSLIEELNVLDNKNGAWLMKGSLNSNIVDMNSLPKTSTFLGISSPVESTVLEMTTNTGVLKIRYVMLVPAW